MNHHDADETELPGWMAFGAIMTALFFWLFIVYIAGLALWSFFGAII